jgi:hypothetical protein
LSTNVVGFDVPPALIAVSREPSASFVTPRPRSSPRAH